MENLDLELRSFLDLRSWFRTEVPACEVCNEAAVKAQHCQNEGCNVRMHQYCLKNKFSQKQVGRVCPGCGKQWYRSVSQSGAAEEEDDQNVPSQNPQSLEPTVRKRHGPYQEAESNSIKTDSCQPSAILQETKRVTRSSARPSAS